MAKSGLDPRPSVARDSGPRVSYVHNGHRPNHFRTEALPKKWAHWRSQGNLDREIEDDICLSFLV